MDFIGIIAHWFASDYGASRFESRGSIQQSGSGSAKGKNRGRWFSTGGFHRKADSKALWGGKYYYRAGTVWTKAFGLLDT